MTKNKQFDLIKSKKKKERVMSKVKYYLSRLIRKPVKQWRTFCRINIILHLSFRCNIEIILLHCLSLAFFNV